jgi:hypothetical protein
MTTQYLNLEQQELHRRLHRLKRKLFLRHVATLTTERPVDVTCRRLFLEPSTSVDSLASRTASLSSLDTIEEEHGDLFPTHFVSAY